MDVYGGTEEKEIKINVVCFKFGLDGLEGGKKKLTSWVPPAGKQFRPPKPFIQWINQIGYVRVSFDRPIFLPTFVRYPDLLDDRLMK